MSPRPSPSSLWLLYWALSSPAWVVGILSYAHLLPSCFATVYIACWEARLKIATQVCYARNHTPEQDYSVNLWNVTYQNNVFCRLQSYIQLSLCLPTASKRSIDLSGCLSNILVLPRPPFLRSNAWFRVQDDGKEENIAVSSHRTAYRPLLCDHVQHIIR